MNIEKAKISDVPQMHKLINYFADKDEMLPRSLAELYEGVRDCFVAKEDDKLLGCVALHVFWSDLAEVRSLAVVEDRRDQGIGVALIKACLEEAKELGIATLFCLTYRPDLFKKLDFKQVDKMELPRKVWSECFHCPKFPDCDEFALIYELGA